MITSEPPVVVLGVAASDAHVVANRLIAFQLRNLGYHVVNLGACTPVAEFVECLAAHPDAVALVIGSVNGHAVEDLTPLRAAKDAGRVPCPMIVGGRLSVGSETDDKDAVAALHDLGVDHVLRDVSALPPLLARLAAARRRRQPEEASR
ncbi:cobalamin-dependent protein [Micromonospora inyonensis]|uniref:Glutamate mutase subunit S n=1 Tax=Micromonospora inyonensis TaxID=47866 RepID=A0A1C6SML2_9ACTN|nr:cobalamin-dependent protein [Micromonospora inyonensis]SCL30796.1 glutamate mutase subunit S [Micromonospora inyonensis]